MTRNEALLPRRILFQIENTAMHVKFAELPVRDQDRALAFYTTNVGMSVSEDSAYGGAWRWIELSMQSAQTKPVMSQSTTESRSESPAWFFFVDEVEKLHDQLVRADVEIQQKPETSD